jgi:hypothetical protein
MNQPHEQQMPPHVMVMQMISAPMVASAIYVAAKLGIADTLQEGGRTAEELAKKTQTHGPSLYRLLRALASFGFFRENEKGQFDLTEMGRTLQTNHPVSVRNAALMFGEAWRVEAWNELAYSVKTGKPAFDHKHGAPVFEWFTKHPEAGRTFDAAMTSFSNMEAPEIAAAYDFGKARKMVDVAGGAGALLATVLKKYTSLQGVLFDLPVTVEAGKKAMADAGLQGRCEVVGGDFFKSVPAGADIYFMKSIIHDWSDEKCVAILKNCHQAMDKNGKVVLAERVIPPGNEPFFGKLLDLEMLVMTQGGKERTEAEYRKLFEAAGFRLTKIVPTRTPMSVIEAIRV